MKQGIYEQSADPLYPVGKRIQVGQKVLHYCRALTALPDEKRGQGDGGTLLEMLNAFAVANQGDLDITLVTAAPALHEFADGYFVAIDGANVLPTVNLLSIKDNDAPVGPNTTFHLKDPLTRQVRIAGADTCDLHRNIYNNVSDKRGIFPSRQFQSVVCVPLIPITIGYYFWGQT
ncbi:unnamed protein product [marine sediment metagenome]|uniref:Uncharacterized protein n=1 Tax=marine sediment metagenome TaxID=412755 RepID=X1SV20_9ZZZZ